MKLTITDEAAQWYKEELELEDGDYLRFFVRYGGVGGLIPGFSLGVNTSSPEEIHASTIVKNITFYIDGSDVWYFEGKNLHVHLDDVTAEPIFAYE